MPASGRRRSPWCFPTSAGAGRRRAGASAAGLQVEVVRRLVDLEETDPEILREVEEALQSRLSEQVPMQRRRVAGLQAVRHPRGQPTAAWARKILRQPGGPRPLAGRAARPAEPLDFDDLIDLDDDALAEVFAAAEPGVDHARAARRSPELVERVAAACCLGTADGHRASNWITGPDPAQRRGRGPAARWPTIARRLTFARQRSHLRERHTATDY